MSDSHYVSYFEDVVILTCHWIQAINYPGRRAITQVKKQENKNFEFMLRFTVIELKAFQHDKNIDVTGRDIFFFFFYLSSIISSTAICIVGTSSTNCPQ